MKEFNLKKTSALLSIIIIIVFLYLIFFKGNGISSSAKTYTKEGFYFDTIISVQIYTSLPESKAEEILTECMHKCQNYESLYSRTLPNSEISKINHSYPDKVTVSDDTIKLLEYALAIAQESDGCVDPTIGALCTLWDFDQDNFSLPTNEQISALLNSVNYQNVILTPNQNCVSIKDPNSQIDLGFIAKGYIADSLKDYLVSENINSAIINLGGNILTIGQKENKHPFKIGIKNPKDPSGPPLTSYEATDESVVSSGDYERCIFIGGNKYHHILSTQTGYPAESDLSQVTIISTKSIDGDMLSTLCYILGYDNSIDFLRTHYPDIKAIFVFKTGEIKTYRF